jgi:bifunctional non-homologous end joining protein LigD
LPERDLDPYRKKRDPARSPEPIGGEQRPVRATGRSTFAFVIQQHAARRMHWDLRLEIDGVLVSFAIPRGPSLDPKEKRMAVQTEDHPMEYSDFEGVIPPGNYGAGPMIVWDRGIYRIVDGQTPAEGLASGKLDLFFAGHKMRGRWALVRTKGGEAPPGKGWLIFRKGAPPEPGAAEIVATHPASVLSGLDIEELRVGATRVDDVRRSVERAGAPEGVVVASKLQPMLAETADRPFSRDGWIFEMKYDGVRVIAARDTDGKVELWSRRGRDVTGVYPEIARAIAHVPAGAFVIDGEIVALDDDGRPSFERLQERFTQSDPMEIRRMETEVPVVLFAFDLPAAEGHDLTSIPLVRRKEVLSAFCPKVGYVRYADHVERDGEALFDLARDLDREGIVAKRADSRYVPGKRSRDWLKMKVPRGADVVVVGWLPAKGSKKDVGSLMTAWRKGDGLVFAGNVGSGLDEETRRWLLTELSAAKRDTPAFEGRPSPMPKALTYVEPAIVVGVKFTEVTDQGFMRHPVFLGVREGKRIVDASEAPARAQETAAEAPAAPIEPAVVDLKLRNLDKVFWPAEGYTKGDLLAYYEEVWPWLAPYLKDRPVVLTRYPDGIEGKSFYQKNAPDWTPPWAETFHIDDTDYFICNDVRTLLHVVNSGAIPLHVWSARRGSLDRPDWTILDLDPKGAPFADVITLANEIHALLGELGAEHFVKTSGQDGIHVLIPLGATLDHGEAKTLAEVLARVVQARHPDISTVARRPEARGGKVYIDFLQNGFGKLIASQLSVRPRAGAPVSTPLRWEEVGASLDPSRFTMKSVPARLRAHGDPMIPLLSTRTDVPKLLGSLSTLPT